MADFYSAGTCHISLGSAWAISLQIYFGCERRTPLHSAARASVSTWARPCFMARSSVLPILDAAANAASYSSGQADGFFLLTMLERYATATMQALAMLAHTLARTGNV